MAFGSTLAVSGDTKSTGRDTKSTDHDTKSTDHDILTTLGDTFTTLHAHRKCRLTSDRLRFFDFRNSRGFASDRGFVILMPITHRSFAMIEPPAGSGTQAATPEQNKLSATISVSPKSLPLNIGERYELQGIIAKGGMGEVHSAWDHVLKRSVAVKLLHDKLATELIIKRFHYEAHITGQLQHPSIPPVHDLGTTADGKPYLVMKLIKGRTLEDLIKQPGEEKLNVLAIFEAIAQAIGYAHSRAVIHRDLKPLNVMVGAFGEVQVMDWGLAKFRSDSEATTPEASIVSTFYDPRTADDSKTSAGSIMGTPSYMPPEQAIGAIDQVNERSDVFGLGGILCAMLTGKPVFVGVDAESTRQLAAKGKVGAAFARLDACDAEPEVRALAKRCLAVEPSERPANGYEVAKIVAKLRNDADERAKQAEIGQARSDTRRRVLNWSAAAVFVVLSAGIAMTLLQAKRATEAEHAIAEELLKTQEAKQATSQQLVLTQAAESAAVAKTKEVEATLVVVGQRTKMLGDAYGDFVFDIQNVLENRPGTQDLRRALLEKARAGLKKILDEARKQGTPDSTLVWSHFRMGDIEQQLGNTLAAQKEYQAGHEMAVRFADADPKNAVAQRDLGVGFDKLGDVMLLLGQTKEALDFYQKALVICQRLADADPKNAQAQRDLSVGHWKMASVFQQEHDYTRAIKAFEKAETLAQGFSKPDFYAGDLAWIRRQLATCRKTEKALADLDFALKQPTAEVPRLLDIRMQVFAKKSDQKNLLATAIAYEKLATTDDRQLYGAACAWSQASGLAKDDAKLREEYAVKAMMLLWKTPTGNGHFVDSPAKLAAHMKQDADMNPLRERADFKKRIANLEAPPKTRELAPPPRAK